MKHQPADPSQPLSRRIAVVDVPDGGATLDIVASADELKAIATALGLPGMRTLRAEIDIRPNGRRYDVTGSVAAQVTQICGVTLEPFDQDVDEAIAISFAADPEKAGSGLDGELPDPLVGGTIDLGSVALEFLALGLDPYPRKPGVSFDSSDADAATLSPFAALKGLARGD